MMGIHPKNSAPVRCSQRLFIVAASLLLMLAGIRYPRIGFRHLHQFRE